MSRQPLTVTVFPLGMTSLNHRFLGMQLIFFDTFHSAIAWCISIPSWIIIAPFSISMKSPSNPWGNPHVPTTFLWCSYFPVGIVIVWDLWADPRGEEGRGCSLMERVRHASRVTTAIQSTCGPAVHGVLWESPISLWTRKVWGIDIPIGSMYAIDGNIYHQYTPNVSIYTIHGSYGIDLGTSWNWHSYFFKAKLHIRWC